MEKAQQLLRRFRFRGSGFNVSGPPSALLPDGPSVVPDLLARVRRQ